MAVIIKDLKNLRTLRQNLQTFKPQWVAKNNLHTAGVCAIIIKKEEPELLFTLRASGLGSHAGQVSFPGGMRERQDKSLLMTALRETEEEIGIAPHHIEVIRDLSPVVSIHGIWVRPFVGLIDKDVVFNKNNQEVAKIFTIPLTYLKQAPAKTRLYTPAYTYQNHTVWGLTGLMVKELLHII